jgi:hypothetical protein
MVAAVYEISFRTIALCGGVALIALIGQSGCSSEAGIRAAKYFKRRRDPLSRY